jgi:hypothetical protein
VLDGQAAPAVEDEPVVGYASLGDRDDASRLQHDDDGDGGHDGPPPVEPPTDHRFGGRSDRPKRPSWMRKLVLLVVLVIGMMLSMSAGWQIGKVTAAAMNVVNRGMT